MPRLRPFVKFDKDNQVVPGSLVFSQKIPKPGKWREISLEGCCDTSTLQNNPPNKLSTQVVCEQVTFTGIIVREGPRPEVTYYECGQDENGDPKIGQKIMRIVEKPFTVCASYYASGSLYPYFSVGDGTVLEQGDCFVAVPGCGKIDCIPCPKTENICISQAGQPIPNCVQTVITADQGVDFTVMFLGCGNDEYTTITVPAGQTSTDVIGVICRNFRLGDVMILAGDGSIEDFNTCTSTFNPWFNETITWGEDTGACSGGIPITVTGNGTTFCNSTTFTGPDIAGIGTGTVIFSFDGDYKTVNVTSGSDVATFNGGCDPCGV
jgi:hypothetical protein